MSLDVCLLFYQEWWSMLPRVWWATWTYWCPRFSWFVGSINQYGITSAIAAYQYHCPLRMDYNCWESCTYQNYSRQKSVRAMLCKSAFTDFSLYFLQRQSLFSCTICDGEGEIYRWKCWRSNQKKSWNPSHVISKNIKLLSTILLPDVNVVELVWWGRNPYTHVSLPS